MTPKTGPSSLEHALKGRRVLVTGDTGFKGAWLCAWLLELGAEPLGYALEPPTRPSLFELLGLERRIDHVTGDVRNAEDVGRRVRAARPDVVVHMAAQSLVRESYRVPKLTFATNVMGTVHLLEAVRERAEPCVVLIVTSDKCYENTGPHAYVEDDPMGGHDPYSASKGAAELVVGSYRRSFFPPERRGAHGVALASVRAGNVIGGGDWSTDRLVPDIVKALDQGRRPPVRNPEAVRPWQHVLDALSGYLWLAARMIEQDDGSLEGPWNFGPLDEPFVSVGQLTDRILARWSGGGWEHTSETHAPHEAEVLRLDCRKAVQRLSWRPVWDVDAAIRNTVDWYRAEAEGKDMAAFTVEQIAAHSAEARREGVPWAEAQAAERP